MTVTIPSGLHAESTRSLAGPHARAQAHTTPTRPDPSRPDPYPARSHSGLAGTSYAAYLDSMLAHLGRVQRGAAIRYYCRRLEEARNG